MSQECFNCVEPAAERYTLILADAGALEEKFVCEECISELRQVDWIEVEEAPSVARDRNAEEAGPAEDRS